MTVKGCVIVGPDKWFLYEGGSADQIALHNVEHFSLTDNVSTNGGDSGINVEYSRYGTVSGNVCVGNFGPGINIGNGPGPKIGIVYPCFIHVNANVCINNCRRIKLRMALWERAVNPRPGEIIIVSKDVLITNNQCCDSNVESNQGDSTLWACNSSFFQKYPHRL